MYVCVRMHACMRVCFLSALTIALDERAAVSLVQLGLLLGGGFAIRPLHEEVVVFAEGAFPDAGAVQWVLDAVLLLLLQEDWTATLLLVPVRVTFAGPRSRGAEGFAVPRVVGRRPERMVPAWRRGGGGGAVIRVHGCHVAVWNTRLRVHAYKCQSEKRKKKIKVQAFVFFFFFSFCFFFFFFFLLNFCNG